MTVDAAQSATPATPARAGRQTLTDALLTLGAITPDSAGEALHVARERGIGPEDHLLDRGRITHVQLARARALVTGLPYQDLAPGEVDMLVVANYPAERARRQVCVPITHVDEQHVRVAIADPTKFAAVQDVEFETGKKAELVVAAETTILRLIDQGDQFGLDAEDAEQEDVDLDDDEDADAEPVVRGVSLLIADAAGRGASDIHLEPERDGSLRVRLAIDGQLELGQAIPSTRSAATIAHIKARTKLNVSNVRQPQYGRMRRRIEGGKTIDLRVQTLPVKSRGEAIVLRLQDVGADPRPLEELGFAPKVLPIVHKVTKLTSGLVLVVGPNGGGKTNTLYALLDELRDPTKSIVTVEDPIERDLPGILQLEIDEHSGFTWSVAARSLLRANQNIVMFGEIRPSDDTAQQAVTFSQRGGLVLSTLHAENAAAAIPMLLEMGVAPSILTSTLRCVVAQRLARRLCTSCARDITHTVVELQALGIRVDAPMAAKQAVGCNQCNGTGYQGRIGLFEVMAMSNGIRDLVREDQRPHSARITEVAEQDGMATMAHDALLKVKDGTTSLDEILARLGEKINLTGDEAA